MAKQEKTDQQSEIIPSQSRMARAALEWGIRDLAKAALVSHDTVVRFERGEELKDRTVDAIREAFERHGVEFIAENGGGPGVRLAKRKGKKRAS
jgi:creatinine amidohydrolase/Fe(II)-dependent formamide hydrolase-like protein